MRRVLADDGGRSLSAAAAHAKPLEPLLKLFRNQIKNPLNPSDAVVLLAVSRFGLSGDAVIAEDAAGQRLIIRDPHPLRRTIQLAPAVDWRVVSMIFVELRYLDSQNGVDEQQTLAFFDTPQDRVPKTFSISLVDGNQRLVSYTTTFVLKDNRTIVVPASMTMGSTIILRSDMAGHRIVTVAPPEVDFAARGIVRIEAQLSYQDADNGLAFSDKFTVASARDVNYFEFDYVSPTRSTYSCTVTVVLANGLVVEHDLGTLNGDRVTLPTG